MDKKPYDQQLAEKLKAARKRIRQANQVKAIKSAAPDFFEIIDGEISLVLNKVFGDKPLPYDDYLSAHGEMRGMKRIRDVLNSKEVEGQMAQEEATAIQKNIKQIRDDKKQNNSRR